MKHEVPTVAWEVGDRRSKERKKRLLRRNENVAQDDRLTLDWSRPHLLSGSRRGNVWQALLLGKEVALGGGENLHLLTVGHVGSKGRDKWLRNGENSRVAGEGRGKGGEGHRSLRACSLFTVPTGS